ncbi:hypothetical protein HDV01_007709 [Terramyces sp. JEL0728]|nr:hypothetical protein HDV01_007709 [Terramyces sp. JEL0728]
MRILKILRATKRYTHGIILVNQSYMGSMYNDVIINYKPQFSIQTLESMLLSNTKTDEIWRYYQCVTHEHDLHKIPTSVFSLLFEHIKNQPDMDKIGYLIRDLKMINRYPSKLDYECIYSACKLLQVDVFVQITRWNLEKRKTKNLMEIIIQDMKLKEIMDQIPIIIRMITFTQSAPSLTFQISDLLIDGLPPLLICEICSFLHSLGLRIPLSAYSILLNNCSREILELLIGNASIKNLDDYSLMFTKLDEFEMEHLATRLWDLFIPQFRNTERVFAWKDCFIYMEILMKNKKYYEASLVFKRFFSLMNGQVWTKRKKKENIEIILVFRELCGKYKCTEIAGEYDYIECK